MVEINRDTAVRTGAAAAAGAIGAAAAGLPGMVTAAGATWAGVGKAQDARREAAADDE